MHGAEHAEVERSAEGGRRDPIDIRERGNNAEGQPITLDRRLFFQLTALECASGSAPGAAATRLGAALRAARLTSVIYEDVNHARGFAVVACSEDPADFVSGLRPALNDVPELQIRPRFAMMGRTYSTGYEQDLEFWLLRRPRETLLNEGWPWAIWYPLRRKGAFERLEPRDRGGILREHGQIGRAYAAADLAHDVRLACHGLDADDNDFVIGLIGKELHPLSHVVQSMRSTRQTSEFMDHLGPFFVGRALLRNA